MAAPADIALDFSNQAMEPPAISSAYAAPAPRDPWLERRTYAFGGSEVAPLLFAYQLSPLASTLPGWVIEQGEHYDRLGVPKLLAWKSGLRVQPAGDVASKSQGNERERELLGRWKRGLASRRVRPESIRHADSVPKEWFPLVDRHCTRLAVTPDAWARSSADGALVAIQIKCTFKAFAGVSWHHYVQLQAEMAAMNASGGVLLVGEQWVKKTDSRGALIATPDGPVRAFAFEPDAATVRLVRTVAIEGWSLVEALRDVALEVQPLEGVQTRAAQATRRAAVQRCRDLWLASKERMSALGDPTRAHIEEALAEIEGIEEILAKQVA